MRLKFEIGLQLRKIWMTTMMMIWTSVETGKMLRENMKSSSTGSLGYYDFNSINHV